MVVKKNQIDQPEHFIGLQSKPPDAKKLEAARKLRLKQCEMKAIIKEIVTHILVVCVVLVVAYGNHDNRSFAMTEEVKNVLGTSDSNIVSFNGVRNLLLLLQLISIKCTRVTVSV